MSAPNVPVEINVSLTLHEVAFLANLAAQAPTLSSIQANAVGAVVKLSTALQAAQQQNAGGEA